MKPVYYNENDPFCAEWLRRLMSRDLIPMGFVDERSVLDVTPDDVAGFTQCHFFAGIGIWAYALAEAGWNTTDNVWSASCPRQPFSAAGKQDKFDDERHLWPHINWLVSECRPSVIVGEQVANALDWLDHVSTDLEAAGYAFGASDLCAAGFQGAHIRQRLYFVGVADAVVCGWARQSGSGGTQEQRTSELRRTSRLADTNGGNTGSEGLQRGGEHRQQSQDRSVGRQGREGSRSRGTSRLADAECDDRRTDQSQWGQEGGAVDGGNMSGFSDNGSTNAPMLGRNPVDWLYCRDGKWRPVEPGTFPLADADTARVGKLRAYGNALDAETAINFCAAARECIA